MSVAEPSLSLEQQALDTVLARLGSPAWKQLDAIEDHLGEQPQTKTFLRHIFTPGLYTREIFLPKDTYFLTRIHLYEHPFVILKGSALVWSDEAGWQKLTAPFLGVTKAGTRRLIRTLEDTVWVTSHATDKKDPDEIVREVTFSRGKYSDISAAAVENNTLMKELSL